MRHNNPQTILTDLADEIAFAMQLPDTQKALTFRRIETARNNAVYEIFAENKRSFAKVFARDQDGRARYAREVATLTHLDGRLGPDLLLAEETDGVVVTAAIVGQPVRKFLNRLDREHRIEHLGQWIGALASATPHQPLAGTWGLYLQEYGTEIDLNVLASIATDLDDLPLNVSILTQSDSALSNFIIGNDDRLYGVDFEEIRQKPEGWGLLLMARALADLSLGNIYEMAEMLYRGYRMTQPDSKLPREFASVIALVGLAMANATPVTP
jgi:hypothetical protein